MVGKRTIAKASPFASHAVPAQLVKPVAAAVARMKRSLPGRLRYLRSAAVAGTVREWIHWRAPEGVVAESDWTVTTFEGNRRRQHLEFLRLSFREQLLGSEQLGEVAALCSPGRERGQSIRVSEQKRDD